MQKFWRSKIPKMRAAPMADFLKELWTEIQDDSVFNGAASIAYFLLLSIFPAAIFLISLIPYLPIPHLQQAITDLLYQALPEQSAKLLERTVLQAVAHKKGGLLTFGFFLMLWSASAGIFSAIEQMNITYDIKEHRPFWKVRLTALFLLLIIFLLIVGSLSLVIFGGVPQGWLAGLIGWNKPLLIFFAVLRWIILAAFLLLGLELTFYLGPDVSQGFRYVSPGSLIGTILIASASLGFQLYISHFRDYSATYGSLGAVIILMFWLYLVSIALLTGSEINAISSKHPREKEYSASRNK